jgi:sterol desaturase/sphingolipid hydroxylase (fatty acid hydroxylase superfamily)
MELINHVFTDLWATFFSPDKRVFVGYLFSGFVLALIWMVLIHQKSLRASLKKVFSFSIWWSPSAKADYRILLINKYLLVLLSPLLLAQITVASFIFYQLFEWFPARPQFFVAWSDGAIALLFTTCYFLFDDFMRFYVHRLLHRVPFLWAFHKVHHSAEVLTPLTVFRAHPIEALIFSLRSIFTQAVAISVLVFFLGDRADLMTVLGAHIFAFVFNVLGANLRHSHVAIYYWRSIERWFISPAQHQIHHSIALRHHDKNYGVVLAVWDVMAGSHYYSEKNQKMVFGLSSEKNTCNPHGLYDVYCIPFIECARHVTQRFKRMH